VYVPQGADAEFTWITDRSVFNLLNLVVSTIAQNLYVDGYRRKNEDSDADAWEIWQANRFDLFQAGIHRSAIRYGYAYGVSLPGVQDVDGEEVSMPALRPVSARRMLAAYEDDVLDEWPVFAVETSTGFDEDGDKIVVKFYDDSGILTFKAKDTEFSSLKFESSEEHGTGFCPVVKYRNIVDLEGDNPGEVDPLIPMQDQINFTTYGLLMAQLYSAFRQRWATGLAQSKDENGVPNQPFRPRVDSMVASENSETKFGEFAATDLNGYLSSRESSIRGMAISSQLPPYQFLGTDDLASAEALAAARDGLDRLINERQLSLGESHEQLLRLASLQKGDLEGWNDKSAQVVWRDTSTRAFAATVDALVKLQTLGIPAQALWEKIPGTTKKDVERWAKLAEEDPGQLSRILGEINLPRRGSNVPTDANVSE
jgi:Phage portal protein, SPP1 Gp6-like.